MKTFIFILLSMQVWGQDQAHLTLSSDSVTYHLSGLVKLTDSVTITSFHALLIQCPPGHNYFEFIKCDEMPWSDLRLSVIKAKDKGMKVIEVEIKCHDTSIIMTIDEFKKRLCPFSK